jgi:hypothetical protein
MVLLDTIWRESNSRLSLFKPDRNPWPLKTPSSDSYRNVYCSQWFRTRTLWVRSFQSVISHFYNGRPIHSEGLLLDMGHVKTLFLAYNTLFEGSGIRHSNAGLQVTPYVYSGSFHAAVRSHTRPRRLGGSHFAPRPGHYKTGTSVWHFPKLSRVYYTSNRKNVSG